MNDAAEPLFLFDGEGISLKMVAHYEHLTTLHIYRKSTREVTLRGIKDAFFMRDRVFRKD